MTVRNEVVDVSENEDNLEERLRQEELEYFKDGNAEKFYEIKVWPFFPSTVNLRIYSSHTFFVDEESKCS